MTTSIIVIALSFPSSELAKNAFIEGFNGGEVNTSICKSLLTLESDRERVKD